VQVPVNIHAHLRQILLSNTSVVEPRIVVDAVFASAMDVSDLGSWADRPDYPGAMYFGALASCHLITRSKMKNENEAVTLKEIEDAISKACESRERALVNDPNDSLAKLGMTLEQRRDTVRRYNSLAAAERRLEFEGKPIPGYRLSREAAERVSWERRADAAKSAYISCVDDALQNLIPSSTDASDVVADATAQPICTSRVCGREAEKVHFHSRAARRGKLIAKLEPVVKAYAREQTRKPAEVSLRLNADGHATAVGAAWTPRLVHFLLALMFNDPKPDDKPEAPPPRPARPAPAHDRRHDDPQFRAEDPPRLYPQRQEPDCVSRPLA
jgi:hypothetical protein